MSSALPLTPTNRSLASPAEQLSRWLALLGVAGLFVLCVAWELWLAPTGSGTLAIKALPLLFPLVGLWRYRLYTFRWVSLMIWVYCGEGLMRATSEQGLGSWLAWGEVALSTLVFIACSMQVRQRLRAAKAEQ